jgi:hypothetical protein
MGAGRVEKEGENVRSSIEKDFIGFHFSIP